jgi:FAD/FMN-containing dehydrogenase
MEACVAAGGSITGEHGVGSDKRDYMPLIFDAATLDAMCAVRRVFDPLERANPGKVLPIHACREWRAGGVA